MERYKQIGKRKKFSKELSDKYDDPARSRIKEVLGNAVIDNPNPKGADMLIVHPGTKHKYLELQICSNWFGNRFPYDKVYIFARKLVNHGPDTLFLVMNRPMDRGYLFSIDDNDFKFLKKRRLKKWSREWVYDIPWHMCMECTVDDLDTFTLEIL